jgi:hypothetical protein
MLWDVDLQPETIINKIFTLNYPARIVSDSFGTIILKLSFLLFTFMLYKLMILGQQVSLFSGIFALVTCLLMSYLLLQVLSLLREISGTKRLLAVLAVLGLLALLIVLI